MPVAAIKKRSICWSRYAENSSRRKSECDLPCLELGWKAVLTAAALKFTSHSRLPGFIEPVCSPSSTSPGATGVCANTTVRCSFQRPNTPLGRQRKFKWTPANETKIHKSLPQFQNLISPRPCSARHRAIVGEPRIPTASVPSLKIRLANCASGWLLISRPLRYNRALT